MIVDAISIFGFSLETLAIIAAILLPLRSPFDIAVVPSIADLPGTLAWPISSSYTVSIYSSKSVICFQMDKEWLRFSRVSKKYVEGAKNFVEIANKHSINSGFIPCPCIKCLNGRYHDIKIVYEHLIIHGMDPQYTTWFMHGEPLKTSTPVENTSDTFKMYSDANLETHGTVEPEVELGEKDVETPLYEGCSKYTKLMGVGKQSFAQYQQHVDGEMATMKQTIANLTNLLMNHLSNIDQAQLLACMPPTQPSISRGSSSQVGGSNNNQCKLLDWMGKGIVVAEAEIDSTDPYAKVHHLELGPDFWCVSVKKVIVSVSLPRPTNELLTLEDALNSLIAWPVKYIIS